MKQIIDRAKLMLLVAGAHCSNHAPSSITVYDEAECDGYCINDDCITSIEELENLQFTVTGLYEALQEMTALAEGPTGGVSVSQKRTILVKARAALAKASP